MGVTHDDIAKLSQVSRGAVSQVLKNPEHPRFAPETRRRIIEAAQQLNYMPNRLAIGLRQGQTRTLGIVIPFNVPELMDTAQQVANRAGYAFMTQYTYKPDVEAELRALRILLEWRVDGIIWQPTSDAEAYEGMLDRLDSSRSQLVFLERAIPGVDADLVYSDTRVALEEGLAHLKEQGYQQVLYVTRSQDYVLSRRRLAEYEKISGGGPYVVVRDSDDGSQLWSYLDKAEKPIALCCECGFRALEILKLLKTRGYAVPEQVGVMSRADMLVGGRIRAGELSHPTLTGTLIHHDEIAAHCVRLLIERCQGRKRQPAHIGVKGTLVKRASTFRK